MFFTCNDKCFYLASIAVLGSLAQLIQPTHFINEMKSERYTGIYVLVQAWASLTELSISLPSAPCPNSNAVVW